MSFHPLPRRILCFLMVCSIVASFVIRAEAQQTKNRPSAAEMMQKAHDARAVWDNFRGFTADLIVLADTKRTKGQIAVSAEGKIELQLSEDDSLEWVTRDMKSLVDHRLPSDESEYDVSFVKGRQFTALGRLIELNEDSMHSVYRIRQDLITEVHRTMGPKKLLISVIDVKRNPEKKHLPGVYTVDWTDAKTGKLVSTAVVSNQWVRVGEFDLPSRILKVVHTEDGSRVVRNVRLTNHKLLPKRLNRN